MPPDVTNIPDCKSGQIGPFPIPIAENIIQSATPEGKIEVKYVCLDGKYSDEAEWDMKKGVIRTRYLKLIGVPFEKQAKEDLRSCLRDPNHMEPTVTDFRSDLLTSGFRLGHDYIPYLAGLSVFLPTFASILPGLEKKPLPVEVSTYDFGNAFFSPDETKIFFGMVRDKCSLGADGDVVLHEFDHYDTYSASPHLGELFDDIEGLSIHEAKSDFGSAVFYDDPQMGESIAKCMGSSDKLHPDIGMRIVNEKQMSMGMDDESHNRAASIYTPFLWFTYERLSDLYLKGIDTGSNPSDKDAAVKKARNMARDVMVILVRNAIDYLISRPTKKEFVRAFLSALEDFALIPKSEQYRFDVRSFLKIVREEARASQLLTESSEAEFFDESGMLREKVTYDYVNPGLKLTELVRYNSQPGRRFALKKGYNRGLRQIFYQQYHGDMPVEGAGVKFVRNRKGARMVLNLSTSGGPFYAEPKISAKDALRSINLAAIQTELSEQLKPLVKRGLVREQEIAFIKRALETPKAALKYQPVFVAGKGNLQHKFILPGALTIYIDSGDGSVSFARQTFH